MAQDLLEALGNLAVEPLSPVIAPVRPTLKHQYPLTPIHSFDRWVRPDGLPLDPWLRTHVRAGGKIIAMAPHSQILSGCLWEWEAWTGLSLPSTGDYVILQGLSPLYIDREQGLGTYPEPNVWVQHR